MYISYCRTLSQMAQLAPIFNDDTLITSLKEMITLAMSSMNMTALEDINMQELIDKNQDIMNKIMSQFNISTTLINMYSRINIADITDMQPLIQSLLGNEDLPIYYSAVFQVIMDFATDIMSKTQVYGSKIDITSLFDNTEKWTNMMKFTFGLQPDAITAVLSSSIKFEKVSKIKDHHNFQDCS